ncbi:hypothetical protein ACFQZ4_32810 [Catellatospora coxensis]
MVQATNRMIPGCYAGVRVTVEVERAAERGVTVADGFVQAPERFQDWLTPSGWTSSPGPRSRASTGRSTGRRSRPARCGWCSSST